MPNSTCTRCGTAIVHHASVVEEDGRTYCCANCAAVATGQVHPATQGRPLCTHCQAPIADEGSRVDHDGAPFCCPNCAATVSHRDVGPS